VREERIADEVSQFGAEIDHMAECILTGRRPTTPGEQGLKDHCSMEAIYRSAAEGRPIALPCVIDRDAFRDARLPTTPNAIGEAANVRFTLHQSAKR
jgi:hypothetical protein